jgi:hypothetical protein
MCKDPQVIAAAQQLCIDMSPIDGASVLAAIAEAKATPRDVIERYNQRVGRGRH